MNERPPSTPLEPLFKELETSSKCTSLIERQRRALDEVADHLSVGVQRFHGRQCPKLGIPDSETQEYERILCRLVLRVHRNLATERAAQFPALTKYLCEFIDTRRVIADRETLMRAEASPGLEVGIKKLRPVKELQVWFFIFDRLAPQPSLEALRRSLQELPEFGPMGKFAQFRSYLEERNQFHNFLVRRGIIEPRAKQ